MPKDYFNKAKEVMEAGARHIGGNITKTRASVSKKVNETARNVVGVNKIAGKVASKAVKGKVGAVKERAVAVKASAKRKATVTRDKISSVRNPRNNFEKGSKMSPEIKAKRKESSKEYRKEFRKNHNIMGRPKK